MSSSIRVYVGSAAVVVERGSTALDAVSALDPGKAARIASGESMITDSRGLPVDADSPVFEGAIFRVVNARRE
jgi:hypothetical protein